MPDPPRPPPVRPIPTFATPTLHVMLDPRRLVRWLSVGRFTLAAAIYLAALFAWTNAESADTMIASLAFACTLLFTGATAVYSEIYRRPLGRPFLAAQALFDLLLVTAAVHVTGRGESQFAALYILVIASAALLFPIGGGLLVAALGCALYSADVILGHHGPLGVSVLLQLGVFGTVALSSGYIATRLKEAGTGTAELAAELVKVRLQAADILRNIRSGVVTIDSAGRLLYANPAANALLGVRLDGSLGRPALDAIERVSPDLAGALRRTAQEGVRINRAEGLIVHGGRSCTIGVTTTHSPGDGTPGGETATAIFQDISDQKRMDALHLRAERLEAVAELSASLAHEIKNPLASIRSAVEQLARVPAAGEDERTLAGLIVRESDRLSRLLSEFLDFARVHVTKIDGVDLGAIVRDAAGLAGAHPDRRPDVRITCTIPRMPIVIDGDEDLLHRIVFNLALNAVQAARDDGRVCVEVEPLAADRLPADPAYERGAVAVRVSDDGPGISADVRARLFDPFHTTKPNGSGLGLAIVHRAVDAHRGMVLVDSGEHGTRFTVVLPVRQPVMEQTREEEGRRRAEQQRAKPRLSLVG
jgi:two-component system, NtrC family, sensor histidine kinase PilS